MLGMRLPRSREADTCRIQVAEPSAVRSTRNRKVWDSDYRCESSFRRGEVCSASLKVLRLLLVLSLNVVLLQPARALSISWRSDWTPPSNVSYEERLITIKVVEDNKAEQRLAKDTEDWC